MKQMAASAATRNVSRSFKSMAGGRLAAELDACRKLPLQDSLLWLRIVRQISPGRKRAKRSQDKIGYFTRPIQGKLPFRKAGRSGDLAKGYGRSGLAVPR